MPLQLDHVLLVLLGLFFVTYPLYGVWKTHRRGRRRFNAEEADAWRRSEYLETLAVLWLASLAAVLAWPLLGRSWSQLGLVPGTGTAALATTGVALAVAGLLAWQARGLVEKPSELEKIRDQIEDLKAFLPRSRDQLRGFAAVSVSAGFCEELLYRGFLLRWLEPEVGLAAAAVLTVVAFGYAHLYQGSLAGFLRTGLVGAVMVVLVLLGGSIWPAVVLHAAIDLVNGFLAYRSLQGEDRTMQGGAEAGAGA